MTLGEFRRTSGDIDQCRRLATVDWHHRSG